MAGRKKTPRLFVDGVYYLAKIYTPEGKRTSICFGHVDNRTEAEVYATFAKWLELYTQQPQKVVFNDDRNEAYIISGAFSIREKKQFISICY